MNDGRYSDERHRGESRGRRAGDHGGERDALRARRDDALKYLHAVPEISYGPRFGFGGWDERPSGRGSGGQGLEERARRYVPADQQGHRHEHEFDPDYRAWRREQIRQLDDALDPDSGRRSRRMTAALLRVIVPWPRASISGR